jgi:hypothetical protein
MTPLNKTLKRALKIKGDDYVVTLSPEFLKISRTGHRLGLELPWVDLVSGETALAVALHASIGQFPQASTKQTALRIDTTAPRKAGPAAKHVKGARRAAARRAPPTRSR